MAAGKEHRVAGAAAAAVCAYYLGLPASMIVAGMIGGLWPDTDIRSSMLGRFIPLWLFFKHRGFTHTVKAALLFSGAAALLGGCAVGICFMAGYLSHLVLDGMPNIRRRRRR